jgi:putative ATPase
MVMELFEGASNAELESGRAGPLAHRMRPRTLEEFSGQHHIVGAGRLLRRVIQADQLASLIFYGPPGTGKTTLARIIANTTKSHFITLNAVLSGVKELRLAIAEAQEHQSLYAERTLLFVDEVHRWNKAQQDALLPWVENGTVILIGATTQNPFFEVNSALVSRSRIFQLTPLTQEDLRNIANIAISDPTRGYGKYRVVLEDDALEHLVSVANGDARSLLNALELAVETTPDSFPPDIDREVRVTLDIAEESIQKKVVLYDKEGDYHFDAISAFIKSIRGSDPDAALYWMARMIYAGEDPRYVFRRMLISAAEDIGLADPAALGIVESAATAFDRVGMPEGQFFLSQAALYLATTEKSNSTLGYFDALSALENEKVDDVPSHLRDSSRDAKGFGHGEGYLYPHAYRDHWVAQNYLPPSLQGSYFYEPGSLGYEGERRVDVLRKREAQLAATDVEENCEVLTFTPPAKQRDRWISRLVDERSKTLDAVRTEVIRQAKIARHHVVLDLNADHGLLLWEAIRLAPEGGVTGIIHRNGDRVRSLSGKLAEYERPTLVDRSVFANGEGASHDIEGEIALSYDRIVGFNAIAAAVDDLFLEHLRGLLADAGRIVLSELVPGEGQFLGELQAVSKGCPKEVGDRFIHAERAVRASGEIPEYARDAGSIESSLRSAGFCVEAGGTTAYSEERHLTAEHIRTWLTPGKNGAQYANALSERLGEDDLGVVRDALVRGIGDEPVAWRRSVAIVTATAG